MFKTMGHGLAVMVKAATQREDVPRAGVTLVTVTRVEGVDRVKGGGRAPPTLTKLGRKHHRD